MSQNPRLRRILMLPNFPETAEDAASLLDIARGRREECHCLKLAAEHAVRQSRIELQLISRQTTNDSEVHQVVGHLQTLQGDLEKSQIELSNADDDVGGVRSLIRRKGFPVEFGVGNWGPVDRRPNPGQVSDTSSDDNHSSARDHDPDSPIVVESSLT
jgi:hypothetical protein